MVRMKVESLAAFFLVVPFRLCVRMFLAERHFMTYLMLIELASVRVIIRVRVICPVGWVHVVSYVLVVGVVEGALGLAIMVKMSRRRGRDRVALVSLLSVKPKVRGE